MVMEFLQRSFAGNVALFFLLTVCAKSAEGNSHHGNNLTAYQSFCYCKCLGGNLARVKNETETFQLANKTGWIALYRLPFIKQLVWMDGSARGEYEAKKPITLQSPSRGKHCVYVNDTEWVSANCFDHHSALCQNVESDANESGCYQNCTTLIPSYKPTKTATTAVTIAVPEGSTATDYQSELMETTLDLAETRSLDAVTSGEGSTEEWTVVQYTGGQFLSGTAQDTTARVPPSEAFSTVEPSEASTAVATQTNDETEATTFAASQTVTASTTQTLTSTVPELTSRTTITPATRTQTEATAAVTTATSTVVTTATTPTTIHSSTTTEKTSTVATSATSTDVPTTDTSTKMTAVLTTSNVQPTIETASTNVPTTAAATTKQATSTLLNQTSAAALTTAHAATVASTTPRKAETAAEAALAVAEVEERLYDLIKPGSAIPPNVRVERLTAEQNARYSEANPLATLSATKVNKLVPHGLREDESFVAVVAQISDDRQILRALSGASEYTSTGYDDQVLLFNATPMLSVTALTDTRRKLSAAASFDFNLTGDPALAAYAAGKSFDLSDFYKNTQKVRKLSYECRYVNVNKRVLSKDGCVSRVVDPRGRVRCDCSHTTSFAVLLSVSSFTVPASVKILSFVTESISTVFLILTLLILVKLRKSIRNDRTVVQINLTAALLLFHVCNLFHDPAQRNATSCEAIAVLTHYFILASAAWMLLEGAILARKTIGGAMDSRVTTTAKVVRYAVGWGVPAVVVFIAAVAGLITDTYMQVNPLYASNVEANMPKYTQCWLSRESGALIGAVLVPVMLVLFANTLIISRMGCFVYKMSQRSENFKPTRQRHNSTASSKKQFVDMRHLLASIKAVAFLIPTLGLPWFLGVLAGVDNYEASVAFMYLNSIVNGLQGLMLFVIYCIMGREVRKAAKSKWKQARAGSQQNFSESKSHSSVKKEGTLQRKKQIADNDLIFGIHQSTQGKFTELPRY